MPLNLILVSSVDVCFYVHTSQVHTWPDGSNKSSTSHTSSESKPEHNLKLVHVPESAGVLNVVLHVLYSLSYDHYNPSLESLVSAVDALSIYGLAPQAYVVPYAPLYQHILSQAPTNPLLVYSLAARHDLYELATPVSAYLLSIPLGTFTDNTASQIEPRYLKRLFVLHVERVQELKRMLHSPPYPHPPTYKCDFAEHKRLSRAWALTAGYIAWEAQPDISAGTIRDALLSLAKHLSCDMCQQRLSERVREVLAQWAFVKRTI
ncbi:hypothetical protein C8Q78DRAFT_365163 [Trametes maxima]|nr:hypothetical protein C8Q78DRAFT_365163 [Trametes maxima]